MYFVFISSYTNTRESFKFGSENSKKLWKHKQQASFPTAFLVLPNFHSCLYSSIETRYMFSISQLLLLWTDTIYGIHATVLFLRYCILHFGKLLLSGEPESFKQSVGSFPRVTAYARCNSCFTVLMYGCYSSFSTNSSLMPHPLAALCKQIPHVEVR